MTAEPRDTTRLREAFRAEVKRATRATAVAGGLIAILAFPLWAVFDHLVDPAHGAEFTRIRLLFELPLVGLWLSLFTGPGRRNPEIVMLAVRGADPGGDRVHDRARGGGVCALRAGLVAGDLRQLVPADLALAVHGGVDRADLGRRWPSRSARRREPLDASALATIGFYLGTASLVAFVGQLHRQMTAWQEFCSRVELEAEQERNRDLLEQLERLSREDSLTGLANRRSWDETLAREFERSRRQDTSLAVLLCDLDRLKEINDRFGHATGDRVLKAAADVLLERVRAGDLAARLGGDEFAVLCPDTDIAAASALGEDLRTRLSALRPRSAIPGGDGLDRRGLPRAGRRLRDRAGPARRRPPLPRQAHSQRGLPRPAGGGPGGRRHFCGVMLIVQRPRGDHAHPLEAVGRDDQLPRGPTAR